MLEGFGERLEAVALDEREADVEALLDLLGAELEVRVNLQRQQRPAGGWPWGGKFSCSTRLNKVMLFEC